MGVTRSKLRSKERRPEPEAIPGPSFPIVGVGASAGGLEAVTQLLRSVPGGAKMAFVLVHHLDPEQPSGLASILSRATRMKVVEAKHGVRVERDHVYVIPPNKTLGISKGTLRLSPRRTAAEPHAPVNYFFRALAEDLDGTLHVKMANRSFYEFFKVNPADTEDRFIYELGKGQWDIPELRELLEKILPAHTVLADFRFEAKFPIVGRRTMLLNAARLATPENDTDWILLAMQDVSGGK